MSSSHSRAELAAMDKDELIDVIHEQSETVDNLETLVHVQIEKRKALEDRVDHLEEQNQQLRDRLDDLEATAQGAYTVANQGTGEKRSKTQVARDLSRNLLVVKVANDCPAADRPVTINDVQEKAKPEHELAWAIVDRAWSKLREDWPQFYETTHDGAKALSIRPDEVTAALAKVVQTDLGRDDLAKRFVGDESKGGVER